jgi:type II secretory pathway component GspD/PulD (secretin)
MKNLLLVFTLFLASCSAWYEEDVNRFSEQEIQDAMNKIKAKSALKEGSFHMQPVSSTSSVRVNEKIKLKKPNLPPYDLVYVETDLEDILLELANSSGETIVIPQSVRGVKVTLTHSGANFQEILSLVLSKAGYSYNYADGIWNITKYPVRNYILEIGQGDRTGSLDTSEITSSSSDSGDSSSSDSSSSSSSSDSGSSDSESDLETTYEDKVWEEVDEVIAELIKYNHFKAVRKDITNTTANNDAAAEDTNLGNNFTIVDDQEEQEFEVKEKSLKTTEVVIDDDNIEPWYKVTKSAGLITVRAAPEAHKQIERYLEQTQESLHRQIFVEVRIVGIAENKNVSRGVQWSIDGLFQGGFTPTQTIEQSGITGGFLSFSNSNQEIDGIIQNMAELSDLQVVSTPQILVRNNQIGYVKITKELNYITTDSETETTDRGTLTSRTDTINSKDIGTILSVLPYIGKNKVQMRLRLSVAQQTGSIKTLSAVAGGDPITNEVPTTSSNIIDQDMILDFGRVYALGGYIEDSRDLAESYVPGFNQLPGISELMKRAKNQGVKTRFVIFVKVNRS